MLYNFLEVLDKLFCSLGYDIVDYSVQMFLKIKYGFIIDRFLCVIFLTLYSCIFESNRYTFFDNVVTVNSLKCGGKFS